MKRRKPEYRSDLPELSGARKRTKVHITKSEISMRTWRSPMSATSQGAFVVIPEISLCDISYIIKKLYHADIGRTRKNRSCHSHLFTDLISVFKFAQNLKQSQLQRTFTICSTFYDESCMSQIFSLCSLYSFV